MMSMLSSVAFIFNLHCYDEGEALSATLPDDVELEAGAHTRPLFSST
jgi:hypothetical protein